MAAQRPSANITNKQNVNPSINRLTEATAEDFKEIGQILLDHAIIIDGLDRAGEESEFYGFFSSLPILQATHPTAIENAFAVIDPGTGDPQRIATYSAGIWAMEELSAPIQFYTTKTARPTTGQSGIWYIVLDEKIAYLWHNGAYIGFGKDGSNGLDAYEVAVALGFTGTRQEWIDSIKESLEFTWNGTSLGVRKVGDAEYVFADLQGPPGPPGDGSGGGGEILYNVETYGSVHDGVTDDTAAIQAAIQAAFDAGGGVVYFPKGVYIIAGALQASVGASGVNVNSQLWIPYYNADIQDRRVIELRGEVTATLYQALGISNRPAANSGVILRSTIQGSGVDPSVIANKGGATNDYNGFSRTNLMVKNISIQLTADVNNGLTMGGINAAKSSIANFENVTVYPYAIDLQTTTRPSINVTGIIMPTIGCEHINNLKNTTVGGFENGYKVGEHTYASNAVAVGCYNGFLVTENHHTALLGKISTFWCAYDVAIDGSTKVYTSSGYYFQIENLITEWKNQGVWYDSIATLNDPLDRGSGTIKVDTVEANTGLNQVRIKKVNGTNVRLVPMSFNAENLQTANYTFRLVDAHRINNFSSGSSISITVPANSSVSFDIGAEIKGTQYGAGGLNFLAASGVTIHGINGRTSTTNQYSEFTLKQVKINEWVLNITENTPAADEPVPTTGLVAYYKFDETTGTVVEDSHGTNNGTLSGVTLGAAGKQGTAYSFDGTDDFLTLSALDGLVNAQSFSTGFWFKTTNQVYWRGMQNRGQGAVGTTPGYQIAPVDFANWGNTIIDNGAGQSINFGDVVNDQDDGNWHFIVLTWETSTGTAKLYIDGVLKSTKVNAAMINANLTGTGTLFGKSNQNAHYFQGEADELFFYQKALTLTEVGYLYNGGNGITL